MTASIRWVPLLFLGSVAISSAPVAATEARVHEVLVDQRHDFGQEIKAHRFRINAAEGRAWLEIDYTNYVETGFDQNSSLGDRTLTFEATGLSYDATRGEVIYSENHVRVVCSNVTERHAFPKRHYWVFENTDNCRVKGARSTGPGNGGIEIPAVYYYETYLESTERTIP